MDQFSGDINKSTGRDSCCTPPLLKHVLSILHTQVRIILSKSSTSLQPKASRQHSAFSLPPRFHRALTELLPRRIINSQFSNLHNASYANFNAQLLNSSADSVAASMHTSNVTSSFIIATLRAANSTVNANGTDNGGAPNGNTGGLHGNPNTGLAMLVVSSNRLGSH